jgi:hypothetical protein
MKPFIFLMFTLLSLPAFAINNPFEGVTGESLDLGVDDCSATKILREAITKSGINLLDNAEKLVSWQCAANKPLPYDGTYCPYPQYMEGTNVTCYSDSNRRHPILCVGKPRVEQIKKYYADAGNVIDLRARFTSIFVLYMDPAGRPDHSSSVLDKNGCNVIQSR